MNDDDLMRLIRRMDELAVAMERGTATPEDHQEYDALMSAVEARLGPGRDAATERRLVA